MKKEEMEAIKETLQIMNKEIFKCFRLLEDDIKALRKRIEILEEKVNK